MNVCWNSNLNSFQLRLGLFSSLFLWTLKQAVIACRNKNLTIQVPYSYHIRYIFSLEWETNLKDKGLKGKCSSKTLSEPLQEKQLSTHHSIIHV